MAPHFSGGITKFLTIAYKTLHALTPCGLSPSRQDTSAHFLQPHYPHCCFRSNPGLFLPWLLCFCFALTTVHSGINLFTPFLQVGSNLTFSGTLDDYYYHLHSLTFGGYLLCSTIFFFFKNSISHFLMYYAIHLLIITISPIRR